MVHKFAYTPVTCMEWCTPARHYAMAHQLTGVVLQYTEPRWLMQARAWIRIHVESFDDYVLQYEDTGEKGFRVGATECVPSRELLLPACLYTFVPKGYSI